MCVPLVKSSKLTHAVIVKFEFGSKISDPNCTRSLAPSKTIEPPFPESNVGPFVNVPLLELLLKSVHVVPLPL